jgi:hypothetical protein
MGWVLTLPITQSKCYLHVSYMDGVQSKPSCPPHYHPESHGIYHLLRCTARPTKFDEDPTAILRSHKHTNTLKETFMDEPGVIWDGYSIIEDVTVCALSICSKK